MRYLVDLERRVVLELELNSIKGNSGKCLTCYVAGDVSPNFVGRFVPTSYYFLSDILIAAIESFPIYKDE